MANYFLDTSALVKRYHSEAGTASVDALFSDATAGRVISRLGLVEVASALALKVRTGEISLAEFTLARRRLLGDVAERVLMVSRVLAVHFQSADELLVRYAPTKRMRTLDALQLAVALDLWNNKRADSFVCADGTLCEIAGLEGLSCINPLSP